MKRKFQAFTLQELLIVLIIISILVLLSLPNLMPLISKAKSTEAKLKLEHVYQLERQYFLEHSKYSMNLDEIYFESDQNENSNYIIEIVESDQESFLASATAINDFDGDGIFNRWTINHKKELIEIEKD